MQLFVSIPIFVLGAIWGSFINMAIYRVKHEQNFGGRSFCDHTKKPLGPLDLIPIFSYLLFRGKCRHCKKDLPVLYPVIELITGILFVILLDFLFQSTDSIYSLSLNFFIISIFIIFFVFFAGYDFLYWQVNVKAIKIALIFASIVVLLGIFVEEIIIGGWDRLIAGMVAGGIIALIVKITAGSGMGEGDIFLMAFAGIFVGLGGILPLFLFSSVLGSAIGLFKASKEGRLKGVKIQFVPFISLAALLTFFLNDLLINWLYQDLFSLL